MFKHVPVVLTTNSREIASFEFGFTRSQRFQVCRSHWGQTTGTSADIFKWEIYPSLPHVEYKTVLHSRIIIVNNNFHFIALQIIYMKAHFTSVSNDTCWSLNSQMISFYVHWLVYYFMCCVFFCEFIMLLSWLPRYHWQINSFTSWWVKEYNIVYIAIILYPEQKR